MEHENTDKVSNYIEFSKIIKDLLKDLINTFADKTESIINKDTNLSYILNYEFTDLTTHEILYDSSFICSVEYIYNYCKTILPEKFFDILYQNEDIFNNSCNTEFLPNINFGNLYFDTTSPQTKETLWKYLQLILFSIITTVDNKESFGNNAHLFEAINSEEFKNKLEQTVKEMDKLFKFKNNANNTNEANGANGANEANGANGANRANGENGANETNDANGANDTNDANDANGANNIDDMFNFEKIFKSMNFDTSNSDLPSSDTIHDHINNLINGKIGALAKELAEETTKDLNLDTENITDVNDVFKQLFKNPSKLMSLVNNISGKLDKKMKDGSIKESELLEEAGSIFKNMKSMPGMDNFESLFKSMNLDQFMPKDGKFNNNAFQHMMDQNIKMSKTRERMRKKAEQNKESNTSNTSNTSNETTETNTNGSSNINLDTNNLNEINNNLMSLMEQMKNMNTADSGTKAKVAKRKPGNKKRAGNRKK